VIDLFGKWGVIVFKFALVLTVVLICEAVGRATAGRGRLAWAAVALGSLGAVAGAVQLAMDALA